MQKWSNFSNPSALRSPGWPENYRDDLNCTWSIEVLKPSSEDEAAENNNNVTQKWFALVFKTFEMEPAKDGMCQADFVEIR